MHNLIYIKETSDISKIDVLKLKMLKMQLEMFDVEYGLFYILCS